MGSRVEYILAATVGLLFLLLLTTSSKQEQKIKPKKVNSRSSEINDFIEYEINSTSLLHTLKAKNAYQKSKKWYIEDANITNKAIKSLTAKKSVYSEDKIILTKDVKAVKRDGVVYKSEKAIYNTKTKELVTPKSFTINRSVDIVKGRELKYNAKERATRAKDVNGTFILKK
jgi:hypothetical protein